MIEAEKKRSLRFCCILIYIVTIYSPYSPTLFSLPICSPILSTCIISLVLFSASFMYMVGLWAWLVGLAAFSFLFFGILFFARGHMCVINYRTIQ